MRKEEARKRKCPEKAVESSVQRQIDGDGLIGESGKRGTEKKERNRSDCERSEKIGAPEKDKAERKTARKLGA